MAPAALVYKVVVRRILKGVYRMNNLTQVTMEQCHTQNLHDTFEKYIPLDSNYKVSFYYNDLNKYNVKFECIV